MTPGGKGGAPIFVGGEGEIAITVSSNNLVISPTKRSQRSIAHTHLNGLIGIGDLGAICVKRKAYGGGGGGLRRGAIDSGAPAAGGGRRWHGGQTAAKGLRGPIFWRWCEAACKGVHLGRVFRQRGGEGPRQGAFGRLAVGERKRVRKAILIRFNGKIPGVGNGRATHAGWDAPFHAPHSTPTRRRAATRAEAAATAWGRTRPSPLQAGSPSLARPSASRVAYSRPSSANVERRRRRRCRNLGAPRRKRGEQKWVAEILKAPEQIQAASQACAVKSQAPHGARIPSLPGPNEIEGIAAVTREGKDRVFGIMSTW